MKVIYTCSDTAPNGKDMVRLASDSIKDTRRFFPRDEVVVFYTPPRSRRGYSKLSEHATVVPAENLTEPFRLLPFLNPSRYGEKAHIGEVGDDTVLFLDCDVTVLEDPHSLPGGYWDFAASPELAYTRDDWDMAFWESMFGENPVYPCFNTGAMLFQNGCHRDIARDFLDYMWTDLPSPYRWYLKDEYAMSLSLSKNGKTCTLLPDGYFAHDLGPPYKTPISWLLRKLRERRQQLRRRLGLPLEAI